LTLLPYISIPSPIKEFLPGKIAAEGTVVKSARRVSVKRVSEDHAEYVKNVTGTKHIE